jgi:mRNA-degrading endonuclease RelE of RelBE toxin-antitoxin system
MEIKESDEFRKDLKRLSKRYRTLERDLEVAKLAMVAEPIGNGSRHWNVLKQKDKKYILKMRMMCRAVKGATFRLVYFYDSDTSKIVLVEVFFKGAKSIPNEKRMNLAVKDLMD